MIAVGGLFGRLPFLYGGVRAGGCWGVPRSVVILSGVDGAAPYLMSGFGFTVSHQVRSYAGGATFRLLKVSVVCLFFRFYMLKTCVIEIFCLILRVQMQGATPCGWMGLVN